MSSITDEHMQEMLQRARTYTAVLLHTTPRAAEEGARAVIWEHGRRNFELGVVTEDERWLDAVQALYDHVWRGEPCAKCRLRDQCEAPLDTCDADPSQPDS